MNLFLKLSVLTLLIHQYLAADLISETLYSQIGASYTVMLAHDNITLKECFLSDDTILYEIDLNSEAHLKPIDTDNFQPIEEDTNILTSLEVESKNNTEYVSLGDKFEILCGDVSTIKYENLLNCELYNPQGFLISSYDPLNVYAPCYHYAELIKMSDYGVWKCVLHLKNDMNQVNVYYEIIENDEYQKINTWQNETDTYMKIGCSIENFSNSNKKNNFCEMVRPDGKKFTFTEGLATDRYTTLSTKASKEICGIEIKKPLKEFERGLWRCQLNYKNKNNKFNVIGGLINLSRNPNLLPPPKIPKKIVTRVNDNFTVTCQVPYASSYCYILGTDKKYPIEDNQEFSVGLCTFTKTDVTLKDNGTWYCGFGKKTGEPAEVYPFEVEVMKTYTIKPEAETVYGSIGGSVFLKCSTEGLGDFPINYCIFSRLYTIYNINPEESSDKVSYYGRGFKYGDCGMELKNVQEKEYGYWSCFARVGYNHNYEYPEVSGSIFVNISQH